MSRYGVLAMGVVFAVASSSQVPSAKAASQQAALVSGVDMQYADHSVRAQDDLYRYLNGKWLDSFQLPSDKGSYGSFAYIDDTTQEQLRGIVEGLVQAGAGNGTVNGGTV